MKMSQKGKIFLAGLEGVCLTKYLCSAGVWTIGVGATRSEIPDIANWPKDKAITIEESFDLLNKSLVKYEKAVIDTLKVEIEQHQFDALVSIAYNIGTGGLKGSTFMKRINARRPIAEIQAAIMMWNKPKEIIGRRRKEANLYANANDYGDGTILVFPVNVNSKPVYGKGYQIDGNKYL